MIWKHLAFGLAIRLVLCLYAAYHDSTFTVKYTDVDYQVFTDGARLIAHGRSPYDRDTYRYTPLVAYMMLPNELYHPMCGKLLLCVADVLAGLLIYWMVSFDKARRRSNPTLAAVIWLYNPFTMAISSRGSFEPIQCCLVHFSLWLALKRSYLLCGLIWGFSVHMKMYTVIYGLAFYIWANVYTSASGLRDMLIPNTSRVLLGIGALLGFGLPTGYFYNEYGNKFLYETFLYHLQREDTQHNYSPMFYPLRLLSQNPSDTNDSLKVVLSLCFTLGQLVLVTRSAFRYAGSHLPFALFTQTCCFVIFNRVATSQYFIWYLCLFPLVIHRLAFRPLAWAFIFAAWLGAQGQWLLQAYYYEFEGLDNLMNVFIASMIYVMSHAALLLSLIHRYDAAFKKDGLISKAKRK
ncbi:GPI mannosyltransferase 1-like [Tropilaelaps mercedesae]|uniref:GPI alpha-1,4-mannosyltransferase I, catalytic subunit n=1 Tax=Tropilaelaps mercedesae TaxID=418985 RepID=A0A1V9WYQ9_9ACAR|nr:GPI mannosyltransferase 1-like [Tropilaelaps mercedesae]